MKHLFHSMKLFVSSGETLRFALRNEPIRVNPASIGKEFCFMCQSCFRPIGKEFCFTRKQIQLLLHND